MSPQEAHRAGIIRKKIRMYDQCVIALGHDPDMEGQSEEVEDLVEFLEYEGCELRDELQELEDGTYATWAPFREMLSSDDPEAVARRYKGAETQKRMDQHRQARRELFEKTDAEYQRWRAKREPGTTDN